MNKFHNILIYEMPVLMKPTKNNSYNTYFVSLSLLEPVLESTRFT